MESLIKDLYNKAVNKRLIKSMIKGLCSQLNPGFIKVATLLFGRLIAYPHFIGPRLLIGLFYLWGNTKGAEASDQECCLRAYIPGTPGI